MEKMTLIYEKGYNVNGKDVFSLSLKANNLKLTKGEVLKKFMGSIVNHISKNGSYKVIGVETYAVPLDTKISRIGLMVEPYEEKNQ